MGLARPIHPKPLKLTTTADPTKFKELQREFKSGPEVTQSCAGGADGDRRSAGRPFGALNLPVSSLKKNLDKLPGDKPIIFLCGAGARSGEAHDMVKFYKPRLTTDFLDADIKWTRSGVVTIIGKK